jgi:hypothetical protein
MCLIEVKLTQKATESRNPRFFFKKYADFFVNCEVMEQSIQSDKLVFHIYVRFPENKVSAYIINKMCCDSKIEKVTLIS